MMTQNREEAPGENFPFGTLESMIFRKIPQIGGIWFHRSLEGTTFWCVLVFGFLVTFKSGVGKESFG